MDEIHGESEEIGPIQKEVRVKLAQLAEIKRMLQDASKQRAAQHIDELQVEFLRRLWELEKLVD